MKLLVVYSSMTGNTRKVAEAIAGAVPGSVLLPVEAEPSPDGFDLVAAGYWVDKGMPDAKSRAWLEKAKGCRMALFGTLGAWPDSEHAKACMRRAAELVESPERGNVVCGSWICQGRIAPRVIEAMQKMAPNVHPMTPARRARIEEAAKHPDESDLASAREFIARTIRALKLQA
ncbi:MAG: flavodoxin family protein [bacterium]|nr:flavodoxin family protein [bacterium]